jgi:pyruvate-ferredoxin/flavodoxin oxidoreductase
LKKLVQQKLITSLDVSDTDALTRIIHESQSGDLKVADLAHKLDREKETSPVDQEWLMDITRTLAKLKNLKWKYTQGTTGKGRSAMGMCNSTGCTSVWGSTYPFNPYPFPMGQPSFPGFYFYGDGYF